MHLIKRLLETIFLSRRHYLGVTADTAFTRNVIIISDVYLFSIRRTYKN